MEKISKDDERAKRWMEDRHNAEYRINVREQELEALQQEVDKRRRELPSLDVNDVVVLIKEKEIELRYLTEEVKKLSELLSKIE
jgi:hypothetical protein